MNELSDLYQELILDHNKRPRNRGAIDNCAHHALGHNPLCGDRIDLYVELDGDVIREIRFDGCGCAISTASASLMTEAVKGRTLAEAQVMFEQFLGLVMDEGDADGDELGKLRAFANVGRYPARVKCATLAWHTLQAALHDDQETVTTE